MPAVFTLLILSFIGTLGARQPDIDINRIKLLPKEDLRFRTLAYHRRRSLSDQYNRRNDYGYHSSWVGKLRAPVHVFHGALSTTEAPTGKIYQPPEDPRVYYQSDAYIKEINRKNINNEVSSIYLGRGEVQASADSYRPVPIRFTDNEFNNIDEELCIHCPHDRVLVAKAGLIRVLLQRPHLTTCAGREVPRDTHFIHKYGPKFGSLIKEGSHVVVGLITHKGDILQTCKMQIQMLMHTCSVPKYLVARCTPDHNKSCSFTCRNPKAEMRGRKILTCGEDMKWLGRLPVCTVRSWCTAPPPPEHGKVACQGKTLADGRLAEGARCRVKCEQGWRTSHRPRALSTCRRGLWNQELRCQPKPMNTQHIVNNKSYVETVEDASTINKI